MSNVGVERLRMPHLTMHGGKRGAEMPLVGMGILRGAPGCVKLLSTSITVGGGRPGAVAS